MFCLPDIKLFCYGNIMSVTSSPRWMRARATSVCAVMRVQYVRQSRLTKPPSHSPRKALRLLSADKSIICITPYPFLLPHNRVQLWNNYAIFQLLKQVTRSHIAIYLFVRNVQELKKHFFQSKTVLQRLALGTGIILEASTIQVITFL